MFFSIYPGLNSPRFTDANIKRNGAHAPTANIKAMGRMHQQAFGSRPESSAKSSFKEPATKKEKGKVRMRVPVDVRMLLCRNVKVARAELWVGCASNNTG